MVDTRDWTSKTGAMTKVTVFEIEKRLNHIDAMDYAESRATMWDKCLDVEGKPLQDEQGHQLYDALIFYKVNPTSKKKDVEGVKEVKMPTVKMPEVKVPGVPKVLAPGVTEEEKR